MAPQTQPQVRARNRTRLAILSALSLSLLLLPLVSAHATNAECVTIGGTIGRNIGGNGGNANARRDSNGMDMSMDGAMSLASGMMMPFFHFRIADPVLGTPGDPVWFEGWVPQGPGAMFGTCVGLFMLGVIERWIGSVRAGWEGFWGERDRISMTNERNAKPKLKEVGNNKEVWYTISMRSGYVPRFVGERDVVRGLIHVGQVGLGVGFMLVVMTYQVGYILAIVAGQGVGEGLFGRYMRRLR